MLNNANMYFLTEDDRFSLRICLSFVQYPISEFEQPFAFLVAFMANGASWTLYSTNDAQ